MVATPTDPLWINVNAGAPSYTANELRTAFALGLMYDGRRVGGRKGVRPGSDQLLVSYAAPTITIQPGVCALDPALTTTQGPYWGAILTADTFTLTAADAVNPRKDIVIARVYDHDEDASGLRKLTTEYLVGTAAGSPVEPTLPASAIKLALLDVPASPGTVVVTDTRPWTVAPGGILPVRERPLPGPGRHQRAGAGLGLGVGNDRRPGVVQGLADLCPGPDGCGGQPDELHEFW